MPQLSKSSSSSAGPHSFWSSAPHHESYPNSRLSSEPYSKYPAGPGYSPAVAAVASSGPMPSAYPNNAAGSYMPHASPVPPSASAAAAAAVPWGSPHSAFAQQRNHMLGRLHPAANTANAGPPGYPPTTDSECPKATSNRPDHEALAPVVTASRDDRWIRRSPRRAGVIFFALISCQENTGCAAAVDSWTLARHLFRCSSELAEAVERAVDAG